MGGAQLGLSPPPKIKSPLNALQILAQPIPSLIPAQPINLEQSPVGL